MTVDKDTEENNRKDEVVRMAKEQKKEKDRQTLVLTGYKRELSSLGNKRATIKSTITALHSTKDRYKAGLERSENDLKKEERGMIEESKEIKNLQDEILKIKRDANEAIQQRETRLRILMSAAKNQEYIVSRKKRGGEIDKTEIEKTDKKITAMNKELLDIEKKIKELKIKIRDAS